MTIDFYSGIIPDSYYDEPDNDESDDEQAAEEYKALHYDEQIEEAKLEGWID